MAPLQLVDLAAIKIPMLSCRRVRNVGSMAILAVRNQSTVGKVPTSALGAIMLIVENLLMSWWGFMRNLKLSFLSPLPHTFSMGNLRMRQPQFEHITGQYKIHTFDAECAKPPWLLLSQGDSRWTCKGAGPGRVQLDQWAEDRY